MSDVQGLGADILRQDLSWALACVSGLNEGASDDGHPLMFVMPQFCRIVYEGERFLVRQGVPVPFEPRVHEAVVAKGRHTVKLWERRRTDIAETLVALRLAHNAAFTGSAVRFVRWLAPDLGIFEIGGALLATTQDLHLRSGHHPEAIGDFDTFGQAIYESSIETGAAVRVLTEVVGGDLPTVTVRLGPVAIDRRDRFVKDYYHRRFGRELSVGPKELLAMIEGHINTHRLLVEASCDEDPALRAGLITAFHAAASLAQIRDMEKGGTSVEPLRGIMSDPNVKAMRRMKVLRNLCMHYAPQGAATSAATFEEAVMALAKCSTEALRGTVHGALTVMSDGLGSWAR